MITMKITIFIIIKCCVFLLIKGQAPGDRQQICRTDFRYYDGLHDWVPYANDTFDGVRVKWQVLLDQYDYQNILGNGIPAGVWTARDVDGDGRQMTQSGSVCTNSLRIRSTFSNPNSNNWVFTQAVNYLDAVEVIVNATVRFAGCIQRNGQTPPCLNNFVNLHRYDTNSQRTQSDVTNTGNYQPYLGDLTASRFEATGMDSVSVINSFTRPNESALTYFGIQDVGSYGDIQRIIVYYRVAPGYEQGLVICPNVSLQREGSGKVNSRNCTCKTNATAITSLERKCNDTGDCKENPVCACNPGYQYNQTLNICKACPVGTYKPELSNITLCRKCPVNSTAENMASTVCECICGTTRDPTKPTEACQDIETFIRNQNGMTTTSTGDISSTDAVSNTGSTSSTSGNLSISVDSGTSSETVPLSGPIVIVIAVVGTFIPTSVITALVVIIIMKLACK